MTVKRKIQPADSAEGRGRKPAGHRLRFNAKAAVVLAAIAVLVGVAFLLFEKKRSARVREQVLAEALEAEKSDHVDLSIRNLRLYLDSHPDDVEALEQLARIMAQSARSLGEVAEAAKVNDQLLRKDPEGKGRQETRRRLVELHVRSGDSLRSSALYRVIPSLAIYELKYQAALGIARDLVRRSGQQIDPKDHRLLAMALEGLAVPGDQAALIESVEEYKSALKGDPADVVSAERLARIYQERKDDYLAALKAAPPGIISAKKRDQILQQWKSVPDQAMLVLDELLRANPKSAESRMVRHRYFLKIHRKDLAAMELEKATGLAPTDLGVHLTAASDALRRGDVKKAKSHLAAIPESMQSDLRVRVMRGMIQFSEERPDEAINSWREGLLTIGGTDADLTWWLAHALLQMGRIAEARPLVSQYHRLSGEDEQPLDRFLQADLNEKTGHPARAIFELEWVKDRIGDYWQAMVQAALGRCYEALWDRPKALAAYRRACQLDPRLTEARIAIARLLAGKPEEAVQEIERGLSQSSDDPALLITLAATRLREQTSKPADKRAWGDFDRALAQASAVAPANSSLLLMRAERLAQSGDLPGAIALLEKSVAEARRNSSLWTAWAEGLFRSGKPQEALKVLDRAAAPEAIGDRSSIRIARAKILLALGRGREAREGLIRDEQNLKLADRPPLWEAIGQLDTDRGDFKSAQVDLSEWAKLLPDDPRPRLALLDLALAEGNESAVRSIIETLKALGGDDDIAWRLCRAQELLWSLNASGQPVHRRDSKLREANQLLESILKNAPEVPSAHLLKGDVLKRLDKLDEATASYRRAWDRGSKVALPRLVELLIRRQKFDELNGLKLKGDAVDLDRLSAAASFRNGDVEAADRFVRQAVEEAKKSPGSLAWQAQMLETIGKPDEAEAELLTLALQKPTDLEPWLDLIRSQARHGRTKKLAMTVERAKGSIKADDPGVLEARLQWAANDKPAADKAFEAAMARRTDDAGLRLLASRYYEESARPVQAAACLKDALRIAPKNRGAALQLAILLAADPATWPGAVEIVGTEPLAADSIEDRLARAMVMSKAPDAARKAKAIAIYEDLVKDLPATNLAASSARASLTQLLLDAGQPERASEVAMVTAKSSTNASTIAVYIETLLRSRKLPEALRQLDRLAAIKPGDATEAALRVRSIALSSTSKNFAEELEKAAHERLNEPGGETFEREVFSALISQGTPALDRADRVGRAAASKWPACSWMPAQVLAIRGKGAEALALCQPSIDAPAFEDRWGSAKVAMTVATQNESDPQLLAQVEKVMDVLWNRDSKYSGLAVMSAMLRHLQGRYEDEIRLYRKALVLQPNDPTSTNNLAWILSEGVNRPAEALALIDHLIALIGRKPELLDTRGVILTRLNRFDEAIKDLEELVRTIPSAIGHFHLALAFRKAGRDEEFRRYRELAKKAGLSALEADRTERSEVDSMMRF